MTRLLQAIFQRAISARNRGSGNGPVAAKNIVAVDCWQRVRKAQRGAGERAGYQGMGWH
jgi:hypothetical protein